MRERRPREESVESVAATADSKLEPGEEALGNIFNVTEK